MRRYQKASCSEPLILAIVLNSVCFYNQINFSMGGEASKFYSVWPWLVRRTSELAVAPAWVLRLL